MNKKKFRGKGFATGRWIYGMPWWYNYPDDPATNGCLIQYAVAYTPEEDNGNIYYEEAVIVDPKTVGMCSGQTDADGKLIYEGDIVEYNTFDDFDCYSVVRFGEYDQDGSAGEYNPRRCLGFYVEVDNFTCPDWCDGAEYFNYYLKQQNLLEVCRKCRVIGNIYDNPDLLSKTQK